MKNGSFIIIAVVAIIALPGCKMLGKNKKGKDLPNDGQVYGVSPAKSWTLPKPPGMVYIPPGTFHMGPSDEDINYAYTARNKQGTLRAYWALVSGFHHLSRFSIRFRRDEARMDAEVSAA